MIGIYKITSPTGRIYIGQSIDIERRFRFYKQMNCKKQPVLYASLKKYGVETHTFEILEVCDELILDTRERYWQEHYNVLNGGLNCNLTETSDKPKRHSEQTKEKISKSHMGKKISDESKQKMSKTKKNTTLGKGNSFYGKTHSDEFKQYRSKIRSNGGNPNSKLVLNLETGVYYDCAKNAVLTTNYQYKNFTSWLNGKYKNTTSFIYV
jgi:group I intron endonuclease